MSWVVNDVIPVLILVGLVVNRIVVRVMRKKLGGRLKCK